MGLMQRWLGAVAGGIVIATTRLHNSGAQFIPGSVATGITAHSGGTQAAGVLLTAQYNRVDTVAAATDSVLLPVPRFVGQVIAVMNNASANSMTVYGSGTDTINGVATATGVAQAAGKMAYYHAETIGTAASWRRMLSA